MLVSIYLIYNISGTLVKHQSPVARGNEADMIYLVSSRWNRREELDSQ